MRRVPHPQAPYGQGQRLATQLTENIQANIQDENKEISEEEEDKKEQEDIWS